MKIFIYAEDLRAYTSGTPAREMLPRLVSLRPDDEFIVAVRRGTEREKWFSDMAGSLGKRVKPTVLPRTRRLANLMTLLRVPAASGRVPEADVYLRFEAGSLGGGGQPLIGLVTDLSALRADKNTSLPWYGRFLYKRNLNETLNKCDRIVMISRATRDDLVRRYPDAGARSVVIHNGIADAWFERPEPPDELSESPYWIWYGQITPRKNVDGLLRAYARLRGILSCSPPRLRIVGYRTRRDNKLLSLIQQLDLSHSVDLFPPQPLEALIDMVSGSRGLVFPSFHEGFGMPVVEAMARGRPVLTSSVTSLPEVAGGNAVLCNPANVSSICAGLESLCDPNQWDPGAVESRQAWAQGFTVNAAARRYSELIDEVVDSAR